MKFNIKETPSIIEFIRSDNWQRVPRYKNSAIVTLAEGSDFKLIHSEDRFMAFDVNDNLTVKG